MIRLFELRTEKGLSQRDMARILNISQGTYNNWENSNTQPSIEQLTVLADFFEVSIDFLVGRSDDFNTVKRVDEGLDEEKLLKLFDKLTPDTRLAIIKLIQTLDK